MAPRVALLLLAAWAPVSAGTPAAGGGNCDAGEGTCAAGLAPAEEGDAVELAQIRLSQRRQKHQMAANVSSVPAEGSWKMLDCNPYVNSETTKYPMKCQIEVTDEMLGPGWNCVYDGDTMPAHACFASGPENLMPASCSTGTDPPKVSDLSCYKVTYSYGGCKVGEDEMCGSPGQWGCKGECPAYTASVLIVAVDLYGAASAEMPFEIAQNAIVGLCPNLCGPGQPQCAQDASTCEKEYPSSPPDCWPNSPSYCVPPSGNQKFPIWPTDKLTFEAVACPSTALG